MRTRSIITICILTVIGCSPSPTPSSDATLQALAVSAGTLKPAFATTTPGYTLTAPYGAASLTVTATATDAKVKVIEVTQDGNVVGPVASGSASGPLTVPAVGLSTTLSVKVTAEDGTTTQTYSVTLTQSGTNEASLASLVVSAGVLSPVFVSGTTTYDLTAPSGTASLTITPTATDPHVKSITQDNGAPAVVASGHASGALLVPEFGATAPSTVTITVTAQDGTTSKRYTLNLTRGGSTEANLSSLVVSAGALSPAFASGTSRYSVTAPSGTPSVTVTPTATDAHVKSITVAQDDGAPAVVASGQASVALAVPPFGATSPSKVTITVTAEDGTTSHRYTIDLTRGGSPEASLSSLVVSAGVFSPAFASTTLSYGLTVPFRTPSVTVTPTATDAQVKSITVVQDTGTPAVIASGHASGDLVVPTVGSSSRIEITVTAQDGHTTQTYTVTLTRANGKDASLSALAESSGQLASFSSTTLAYSLRIPFQLAPYSVTPTANDATATIKVNGTPATSGIPARVTLSEGLNTFTIEVTSPDGTVVKSYVLTITNSRGLLNPRTVPVAPSPLATVTSGVLMPNASAGANVPVDTLLRLGFDSPPTLGATGKIQIHQADGTVVDEINLGDGPMYGAMNLHLAKTPPLMASMVNIIGGTAAQTSLLRFVYYSPVAISGNTVTIFPHKNRLTFDGTKYAIAQTLDYGASYYVTIDQSVLNGTRNGVAFEGIADSSTWSFSTRATAPAGVVDAASNQTTFAVNWDNSGDFATVQGALDAVPKDNSGAGYTIAIAPGVYQELLFSGNKKMVTLRGTSGNNGLDTVIQYDNCNAFNPGAGVTTPMTGVASSVSASAGGRAVFLISGDQIALDGITVKNTHGQDSVVVPTLPTQTTLTTGVTTQAEAVNFSSVLSTLRAKHSNFVSYQGTLLIKGFTWFYDSFVTGDVDFIVGPMNVGLFEQSEIKSRYRSPTSGEASIVKSTAQALYPGLVFLNSTLSKEDGLFSAFLARSTIATTVSPDNVAYVSCTFDSHVDAAGWSLRNATNATNPDRGANVAPTPVQGWRQYGNVTPAGAPVDTSHYLASSGSGTTAVMGSLNLTDADVATFLKDRATIFTGATNGTYKVKGLTDANSAMSWEINGKFFSP